MLPFVLSSTVIAQNLGANRATGQGKTVNSVNKSTAGAQGPYVELIASTPIEAASFDIRIQTGNAQLSLWTVAIGASGFEIPIVEAWAVTANYDSGIYGVTETFPVRIPKGARVSVCAHWPYTTSNVNSFVGINLHAPTGMRPGGANRIVNPAFDFSTSAGVVINSGGSNNTMGAWTEVVAATDRDWVAFRPFRRMVASGGGMVNAMFDVALGPLHSEVPIYESHPYLAYSTVFGPAPQWIPMRIPKGSRISMRTQSSNVAQTEASRGVWYIYGMER